VALLAGGGSAQLRRDPGTAGAVDGQVAFGSALAGARLSTALPFAAQFQAGDGQAQQSQSVVATLTLGGNVERERAGGASLTTGTVGQTLTLGGIAERERAGGLATAAGTATIAPGGAVERERAGGISAQPGLVVTAVGGWAEAEKPGGSRFTLVLSIALGGVTEREISGGIEVATYGLQQSRVRIGDSVLRAVRRLGHDSMQDPRRIGSAVLPKKPRSIRH